MSLKLRSMWKFASTRRSIHAPTVLHNVSIIKSLSLFSTDQIPRLVKLNSTKARVLSPQLTSSARLAYKLKHILRKFVPRSILFVVEQIQLSNMLSTVTDLTPPSCVRGMSELDKSIFKRTVYVPSLVVPSKSVGSLGKFWKKSLLKVPGVKPIAELSENEKEFKLVLLDPNKYTSHADLSEAEKDHLRGLSVDASSWKQYALEMDYENWNYNEILSAILPAESEGIGGFSQIGHIAHLNLREETLQYKNIIGAVILDKVKQATMVVNKTNVIDNTYRNFAMEVIAGESDFITTCREHGFAYEFDFSAVYWNPRLGTEHRRVVELQGAGDVVYDVFAGVGPFAIPAAKKKCIVFANDLNPESYKWLNHNIKLNKIKVGVSTNNMDGREFIRDIVRADLIRRWQGDATDSSISVVMNLPGLAIEFLDAFRGLLAGVEQHTLKSVVLPTVYCYCFSSAEDTEGDAKCRVEEVIGEPLPDGYSVYHVRNVAPKKDMLCVTFTLSRTVLFSSSTENHDSDTNTGPTKEKRQKLDM